MLSVAVWLLGPIVSRDCHAGPALSHSPGYPDRQHLLVYRDPASVERPVKSPADWSNRRADILAAMQMVMGPLPNESHKVPLDVRVVEQQTFSLYARKKISFASEADDRVPAWLLLPREPKGRLPAIVCLHQTTSIGKDEPAGLGGKSNLHYAEELARRGYVTLAPDYPGFGEYKTEVYARGYASATMKGIWNHMRAVDVLVSVSEVDPARIGVIGHSLGGHNALFVAVFDPRIKAVVTSCGFNSFFEYQGGDLTGWSHSGYMPRIATLYGKDAKQMPFDFTEVLAAIAPRPVFINAPLHDDNFPVKGVRDCVAAALPVYTFLRAEEKLKVEYPDCAHDFPPRIRDLAYEWLDQCLK